MSDPVWTQYNEHGYTAEHCDAELVVKMLRDELTRISVCRTGMACTMYLKSSLTRAKRLAVLIAEETISPDRVKELLEQTRNIVEERECHTCVQCVLNEISTNQKTCDLASDAFLSQLLDRRAFHTDSNIERPKEKTLEALDLAIKKIAEEEL